MGSGRTYSPAQLNKMNALGGWYSEPSRAVRRTQKRIENMVARREAGKSYSQKNLEAFTGRDEGRGSYTATPTRSAAAASARGVDVGATGMMGPGGRHYAEGGRIGYQGGELVDEDINVQGPGFDVNENIEMASAQDPMDALNDMAMQIFGKPLHELTPEEKQILFDMAQDQAAAPGAEQGIASLV